MKRAEQLLRDGKPARTKRRAEDEKPGMLLQL
jgi:hypothetical protein